MNFNNSGLMKLSTFQNDDTMTAQSVEHLQANFQVANKQLLMIPKGLHHLIISLL